ncbi:MAG: hypothetical protein LUE31_12430 [Lachnospiraceae bacterium]|nr:hypothetical protein [Lachnospiraceae bacterium]
MEAAEGVDVSMKKTDDGAEYAYISYVENADGTGGFSATGVKINGNTATFTVEKDGLTFTAKVSNIVVTPDVDFGILKGLQKANATVTFDDEIELEYAKEFFSSTINIGSVDIALGTTPLSLKLSLAVNIGLNGEATLTYSSSVVANVNYQKGNGLSKSVSNNDAEMDFHAQVTATAEPTVKAELCCPSWGLVNVKVTSGVVAIATVDVDLMGDEPDCIDLFAYVPLRWTVNEDGCVMTSISSKLKASGTVWGSDDSPITLHYHWEDLVLVDACTRGTGEEVVTETVDEDGEPYDEYTLFDFEEIVFGTIKVATY